MALAKPLLSVKNLQVEFISDRGAAKAVDKVSFNVFRGETLGFVGESGCGKSMTMLSILGLVECPPGRISCEKLIFDGEDINHVSPAKKRELRGKRIAMIFQDPMTSLNPVFSVGDQIIEAIRTHEKCTKKQAKLRAVELLDLVGIPDASRAIDSYPHQLSGGMRQRIMIAMALSCQPSLLIADEPTTALDVTIQEQLLELMCGLRDQMGMSLIWITHDLGIVAGIADRINVMYAGRIVESGSIYQIFDQPRNPYTYGLLNSVPRLNQSIKGKLCTIRGVPPSPSNLPKGCSFAPRCNFVKDICRQETPELVEVEPGHHSACWVNPVCQNEVSLYSEEADQ